jgi:signal transduction histidine kinase
MSEEVGTTGVSLLDGIAWGTHLCHFYDTKQDLFDTLVPYFTTGLQQKEFCLWVYAKPLTETAVTAALRPTLPDLDRHLADRSIEIVSHDQWYFTGGRFDPQRALHGWQEKLDAALARGYVGMRATGQVSWIQRQHWPDFAAYERALNDVIANRRMVITCSFPLARTRAVELLDAVTSHQMAVAVRQGNLEIIETVQLGQAKAEIKRLNEELEQRVNELEAFSSSTSHDLRAPLRRIEGFAKLLREEHGATLDAGGHHYLDRIQEGVRKMDDLIHALLGLSRASLSELTMETVNLSRLVHEIVTELQLHAPQRRVAVVIQPDVVVRGDARLLRVALQNLLDNAWKYTSTQPAARIEFGMTERAGQPVYFVRDDGVGFDMAYVGRLFEPFQRLHSGAVFEGTGIGLATVQRILRRHGGRIWAESAPGQGATFFFTLGVR